MHTTYVVVTLLAVAANLYAAYVDFMRAEWVVANMTRYGIPHSWLFWLGGAKAAITPPTPRIERHTEPLLELALAIHPPGEIGG